MDAVSSKISYSRLVKQVYVEREAEQCAAVTAARKNLPALEFCIVDDQSEIPEEHLRGTTL